MNIQACNICTFGRRSKRLLPPNAYNEDIIAALQSAENANTDVCASTTALKN